MAYAVKRTPDQPRHYAGPVGYLWWLVICQRRRIAAGAVYGSLWMVSLAAPPYLVSRAIDDGLKQGDTSAVLMWAAWLLGVGLLIAWLSISRHRTMTRIRLDANLRTSRVLVAKVTELGADLHGRVSVGEVTTIGLNDVFITGRSLTVMGPGIGAVVAYVVVGILLSRVSGLLTMVVLFGVPLLAILIGPLLGRLVGAQVAYRDLQGQISAGLVDAAQGLRVLNSFGGKQSYADRFKDTSNRLQEQGFRVGAVNSWISGLAAGLPTVFLALVTWLAARMTVQGTITIGELVAVYGYVAMLVVPVSSFIEGADQITRAVVSARRITDFLATESPVADTADHTESPRSPATLHDPDSGVLLEPGSFIALVADIQADAVAVAERLGRLVPSNATWGDIRLDAVAMTEVRARILLADTDAHLFGGELREMLRGRTEATDEQLANAVSAAAAEDVVRIQPHGFSSHIDPSGANLSGGQQQRIRLARALVADPEVLLAIEPTAALDAHTEAVLAQRLRAARLGRTTLVVSSSPHVLSLCDVVYYLPSGKAVVAGSHLTLLDENESYRSLLARGGESP